MNQVEQLSTRWRYGVAATFIVGFAFLILLTFTAYRNAPPIPARVVDTSGAISVHRRRYPQWTGGIPQVRADG